MKKYLIKFSRYLPQIFLLFSVLTSNVFFPAIALAEEFDVPTENSVETNIPVDDSEDILDEGISTSIFEENVYTVNEVIEGEEYVYPDNEDVRVKFTKITEPGNLIIQRVELSDSQREELNTSDEYGWDITSTMSNGSFTYDLTLPNTQGDDIEVKYTEDGNTYESVDSNVEVTNDVVTIEGLDHFTMFVVTFEEPENPSPIEAGYNDDWFDYIGEIHQVPSGTHGIISAEGNYHAEVTTGGAFTRYGGYSNTFPQFGYDTRVDVYLDMSLADGSDKRFDFSSAINQPDGNHRRDFIFSLGTDPSNIGQWLVSSSNNAPGWPGNPGRSPVSITETGWYTLEHQFRENENHELVVTMNIYIKGESIPLGTWVLSDPSDIIGTTVGGNRYGWFTPYRFDFDFVAIDNTILEDAPSPTTKLQGRTFIDNNWNGLLLSLDGDYPSGMEDGFTVRLYDENWNKLEEQTTNITGKVGQYNFEDLHYGTYQICGTHEDGYFYSPAQIGQGVVDTNNNPLNLSSYLYAEIIQNNSGMNDESPVCWQVTIDSELVGSYLGIGYTTEKPDTPVQTGYKDADNKSYSCTNDYTNMPSIAIYWSHVSTGNTPPDDMLLYQRQYSLNGVNWSGNEIYSNPYTNQRSFGGGGGMDGIFYSRVRAFYDLNSNNKYDLGEPVSENWSNECSITHDTVKPEINLTLPTDGGVYAGTIDLKAICNEDCDYINFWWREENQAYSNVSPDRRYHYEYTDGTEFNWSLNTLDAQRWGGDPSYVMADGVYYIYAAGKDLAGNWAKSQEVRFIVDNTPPYVEITVPSQGDFVKGIVDIKGYIIDDNLSHYNISLYKGGVDVHNFSLRIEQKTEYTASFSEKSIYTWDTTNGSFPDGEYQIRLAARDLAGNRELNGASEDVKSVIVDNTLPIIGGHSDMILTEGDLFPTDTVTLTELYPDQVCAKAEDLTGGLGDSGYQCIDVDGSNFIGDQFYLADEIREAIEDWQNSLFTIIDLNVLPEGQYEISYYATDKAGNQSSIETFTVTINDNIPTVEITATETEITQGDADIVLGTNITNGNSPFTYLWGGDCSGIGSTTIFSGNSEPGNYTCTVIVTDTDGDTDSDSIGITVGAVQGTTTQRTLTSSNLTSDGTGSGSEILDQTQSNEESETQVLGEETMTCDTKVVMRGYLFLDKNSDNIMDTNEKGIAGVSIRTYYIDGDGNEITLDNFETDENGYWETQVCPGDYKMAIDQEDLPKNLESSDIIDLQIADNLVEPMEFNIAAVDSRNFWQKYWYLILIAGGVIVTIGYVAVASRRREIIQ